MIVKRSSRNQVAIPKKLIDAAGLDKHDVFFDVRYRGGAFILKPLEFTEKLPPEALKRFKTKMLKRAPADRTFSSMDELITALDRKKHR